MPGRVAFGLVVWACLAATAAAGPESKTVRQPHVRVQAFADREAVTPGQPVQLAVSLKMDKGWHVYWRNPAGTGMPTEIAWTAPPGYRVGPLRYPVPEVKYDKVLKERSFIHEGTALFLTTIDVPESAASGPAEFKAAVTWLVCRKNCVPGNATLSLTLPVAAKGATPKPANADLFEQARGALPLPTAKASYVKLDATIDRDAVKPGDTFTATLSVEIRKGHHIQSDKPAQEGLIPATVFASVDPAEAFDLGDVVYPEAHVRNDPLLGRMSEYTGTVVFRIPVEVYEDAGNTPRWIRGVFRYQACNDRGTCYPPENVAFAVPIRMAGGAAPTDVAAAPHPAEAPEPQDHAAPADATGAAGGHTGALDRFEAWLLGFGYLGALVVALIGGVILNLMPCVLPVISLKILSFVRQADEDRSRILQLGLAYCAGILVFFGFIATLYWRAGTGWGQLFQRPRVILGLAAVVTAFALSLFGVFALFTPKIINRLGQKAEGEGALSAFSTGILATFLGTACTAPFLSAALGAASKFPAAQGAGIFFTVGVGMALPFFALSARPGWLKYVPKPGPWMTTFEVVMGFLLLGTVVWLLYPLGGQLGDYGLLMAIIFLLAVATAAWIKGKIEFGAPPGRRLKLNIAVAAVLILGWTVPFRWISTISELQADQAERADLIARGALAKYGRNLDWSRGIPWQHYVPDLALQDVRNGYTVFVDYTARWCVNCKTNLKTSIDRQETIQVMREQNVIPYEADYTNYAPAITRDLKRFGRDGVPLYLVYKPHDPDNPEILPIILTPQDVIDALKRAGPSRPTRQALAGGPKPGPKAATSQQPRPRRASQRAHTAGEPL